MERTTPGTAPLQSPLPGLYIPRVRLEPVVLGKRTKRLELRHAPELSYAPGPFVTMTRSSPGDKMAVGTGLPCHQLRTP